MSEQVEQAEQIPAESTPVDAPAGSPKAVIADLHKERRARRDAERAASDLKAQLDAINTANLSEVERAQKAAADATTRLAEYERTMLRQKVALEKGVPASLAGRLVGDTEDDLAADADALLALVNAPTSPKPDPSQGARGGSAPATAHEAFAAFINPGRS